MENVPWLVTSFFKRVETFLYSNDSFFFASKNSPLQNTHGCHMYLVIYGIDIVYSYIYIEYVTLGLHQMNIRAEGRKKKFKLTMRPMLYGEMRYRAATVIPCR